MKHLQTDIIPPGLCGLVLAPCVQHNAIYGRSAPVSITLIKLARRAFKRFVWGENGRLWLSGCSYVTRCFSSQLKVILSSSQTHVPMRGGGPREPSMEAPCEGSRAWLIAKLFTLVQQFRKWRSFSILFWVGGPSQVESRSFITHELITYLRIKSEQSGRKRSASRPTMRKSPKQL